MDARIITEQEERTSKGTFQIPVLGFSHTAVVIKTLLD
jgi:hypothetical protein